VDEGKLITYLEALNYQKRELEIVSEITLKEKVEKIAIGLLETNMKIHVAQVHLATLGNNGQVITTGLYPPSPLSRLLH
jgi:hypothetical protein